MIAPLFAVPRPPQTEPPFTDERFDALAACHLEGLRVREGGVVGTKSAMEANDSQGDLVVSRSAKCSALRVHVTHPCSRVSITSAFDLQAFRLSREFVVSYNSGTNRLKEKKHTRYHVRNKQKQNSNENKSKEKRKKYRKNENIGVSRIC